VPPAQTGPVERLAGRWLFGGIFYGHFGHFLVESTARLWAADLVEDLAGIVFYPKQKMTHERRLYRHMTPFFDLCGLDHLAIRAPQSPVLIDELVTPPPGFGMDAMMAGRPEYRDWARQSLGRDIAPAGAEHIYVSRARLPSKRGSILLEERLEALMAAAGYTIFHPQEAPLHHQIAQWKAARRIVGLDGSALHLAAMLAQPGAQVALINRGPSQNIEDYVRQFRRFAGIDPLRIEALNGYYHAAGRRVVKRETFATLDVPAVGQALAAGGFIPSAKGWTMPERAELATAIAQIETELGETLAHYSITEEV
jgi:capsular polysaccharide biosynthesis protein